VTGSLTSQVWYAIWAIMIPESIYGSLLVLPGRDPFLPVVPVAFLESVEGPGPNRWMCRR
jgi:hypothetical protein